MCKVLEERFNSQLGVIGASRAIIDMQFGKGFTKGIELGRTMSVDTLRRLSNTLGCSPEWLTGEDIKGGNLLVDVDNLGAEQADLLVDHIFSCHNIGNFVFVFLVILLNLLDLFLDLLFLSLQLVDLLANLAGRGGACPGGQQADDQRQQQHRRHDSCQNGYNTLAIVHKLLLFAWEGVTGRCTPTG